MTDQQSTTIQEKPTPNPLLKRVLGIPIFIGTVVLFLCIKTYNLIIFSISEKNIPSLEDNNFLSATIKTLNNNLCNSTAPYKLCTVEKKSFILFVFIIFGIALALSILQPFRVRISTRLAIFFKTITLTFLYLPLKLITILFAIIIITIPIQQDTDKALTLLQNSPETLLISDTNTISKEIYASPEIHIVTETDALKQAVLELKNEKKEETDTLAHNAFLPIILDNSKSNYKLNLPTVAVGKSTKSVIIFKVDKEGVNTTTTAIAEAFLLKTHKDVIDPNKIAVAKTLNSEEYVQQYKKEDDEAAKEFEKTIQEAKDAIKKNEDIIAKNNKIVADTPPSSPYYQEKVTLANKYNSQIQQYIQEWKAYLESLQNDYEKFKQHPLTPEQTAGFFIPPNLVFIRYYGTEVEYDYSSYLHTTIHEELHFYSKNSIISAKNKYLDKYLNEGITDYLATRYINQLIAETNLPRYEKEVAVITLLASKIPESTLLTIYFSQDESKLQDAFTKYFPKVPYEQFKTSANTMFYSTEKDQKQVYFNKIQTMLTQS
ncbi:MAG: hypothetical protein WCP97_02065 [bacterium]